MDNLFKWIDSVDSLRMTFYLIDKQAVQLDGEKRPNKIENGEINQ